MPLELTSPAFEDGDTLPEKYTCNGDNINPELEFVDIPTDTQSLLVIMDDLDAQDQEKLHWLVWNISPHTQALFEDELPEDAIDGYNDFKKTGYSGPCATGESHRYQFHVYALDIELGVDDDVSWTRIEKEMAGHILDEAFLEAVYPE